MSIHAYGYYFVAWGIYLYRSMGELLSWGRSFCPRTETPGGGNILRTEPPLELLSCMGEAVSCDTGPNTLALVVIRARMSDLLCHPPEEVRQAQLK